MKTVCDDRRAIIQNLVNLHNDLEKFCQSRSDSITLYADHGAKLLDVINNLRLELLRPPVILHIHNRIKQLERTTNGGIVCLQFADHPEGISMNVRVYILASDREHSIPDVILKFELADSLSEIKRVDVLFDAIEDEFKKIQVVQDVSGGLIHH